jgi:uncharacterized protein YbjT (DUF2867 family)
MHMARFVVTGAFGYTGRFITQRLLDQGHDVHTLTNSPDREHPFGDRVSVSPFHFDNPEALQMELAGADVLINTYWVRFNHRDFNHDEAVNNTRTLFVAAAEAGVGRVVHVSITNPSLDSDLPYFRGKAELEVALKESGLSYAILRPAVLFGEDDILVNNIAWGVRRFPIVGVFGDGQYRIQPMYVDDMAALAVTQAQQREDAVIDAVGPETFTFRELVDTIGRIIGKRRKIIPLPAGVGYMVASVVGRLVNDVFLTREEIAALMEDLLVTESPPSGETKLTQWAAEHADTIGVKYASELARRRDRVHSYAQIQQGAG